MLHDHWKRLHPRHSLVAQLSYAFAAISIVLSVVLGYYAAEMSRRQIEQDLSENFNQRAQDIVDALDRSMFERYREVQIVATLDDIRSPRVAADKKRAILEKLQQTYNAYAWIGICDAQGTGSVGTGKYLEGKDLSKRPWCAQGREHPFIGDVHDALLLSKLLPNPSGEMFYLVDVAAPVQDEKGVFQGVLCGHIFWKWAEEMLDSKKAHDIDILLLSRDGLVLAGPEKSRSKLADLAPDTWAHITSTPHHKEALLSQWNNGKRYLIGHAHSGGYRDYPGLGWTALVRQDESVAYAPARALQWRILFTGLTLGLLFALLGAYLARRITRPITRIAQAADKVAAGDLNYDAPCVAGDGEVAHLTSAIHTMVNTLIWEIAARKQSEEQLRLAASVFSHNSEAIIITDAHNHILQVNDAFTRITGFTPEEVAGKNPSLLGSGRMGAEFYQRMWQELLTHNTWSGEIWNKRKSGEVFQEWLVLNLVRDEHGNITNHIAIFTDITERKREEERVQHLASHDLLTGLPNRFLLSDRIDQALAFAERNRSKVGVMFLDLDHFKNINDSLGHDTGDSLLKLVAERMGTCLRRSDTLARIGGDEFVAVLADIGSEHEAATVAEKILESFSNKFLVNGHTLVITPSLGISLYPDDSSDAMELLRNADMAMYRAKNAGRNGMQFYRPEMTAHITERLKLEMLLRHAIVNQELYLVYQPRIDFKSGKVAGVEALLRWYNPELGQVPPTRFIPIAEESDLIFSLGEWALLTACQQAKQWHLDGYERTPVAVNVSGHQLKRGQIVPRLRAILQETQLDPSLLEIELTESVLEMGDSSTQQLNDIHNLGVNLALDDFGTGHSSLSRIKCFPFHHLKIDQSFVRNIDTDADDTAIVRAVIGMAHEMELYVIAEGIETEAQAACLKHLRCDSGQGYLFSHPLPAGEVERHFRKVV